jgi:hypothetical protein
MGKSVLDDEPSLVDAEGKAVTGKDEGLGLLFAAFAFGFAGLGEVIPIGAAVSPISSSESVIFTRENIHYYLPPIVGVF